MLFTFIGNNSRWLDYFISVNTHGYLIAHEIHYLTVYFSVLLQASFHNEMSSHYHRFCFVSKVQVSKFWCPQTHTCDKHNTSPCLSRGFSVAVHRNTPSPVHHYTITNTPLHHHQYTITPSPIQHYTITVPFQIVM